MGLDRLIPLLLVVVAVAGCRGHGPPDALFDGTRPGTTPLFSDDVVVSRVRVVFSSELPGFLRTRCPGLRESVELVQRAGVEGGSLTFRDPSEPGVLACDAAPGEYELAPWCGVSAGRLYGGRLRDPRLDLCQSRDGRLTGFVWIEPVRGAKWIAVDQGSYSELYEVAGDLPVRIASTRDVELEGSRASFDVTQYDGKGRELAKRRVEAAVAG
jgi:hypothetical protein